MVWQVSFYRTVKLWRTGLARTQCSLLHNLQPDGAPKFTRFTHQKPASNAAENVTLKTRYSRQQRRGWCSYTHSISR